MSADIVDTRTIGKNIGAIVMVFGLVGFGLGISGLLTVLSIKSQFTGGGESAFGELFVGMIFQQNTYTTFLLGSVVAAFAGLVVGFASEDQFAAALGGGVGAGVGFYVMAIVSVVLLSLSLGGAGGGTGGLGNYLLPLVGAGIPAAVVGLVSAYTGVLLNGGAAIPLID
jgi:hypothetical protein